jgi:hypothetical protein
MTAGAEMGTGTAEFLGRPEEEGEALVEELVSAGRDAEASAEQVPAEAPQALPRREDRALIDRLTMQEDRQDADAPQGADGPQAAVGPEGDARKRVLEELMDRTDGEGDEEDDS